MRGIKESRGALASVVNRTIRYLDAFSSVLPEIWVRKAAIQSKGLRVRITCLLHFIHPSARVYLYHHL